MSFSRYDEDGARTSHHTHCCIGARRATHCAMGHEQIVYWGSSYTTSYEFKCSFCTDSRISYSVSVQLQHYIELVNSKPDQKEKEKQKEEEKEKRKKYTQLSKFSCLTKFLAWLEY